MLRRSAIIIFGALPATIIALFVTCMITERVYEAIRFGGFGWNQMLGPATCLACLAGTAGLWIVAFQALRVRRNKRVAIIVCLMLACGIVVAAIPLMLPVWWIRFVALSLILTACAVFPGLIRTLRGLDDPV
jgi:hypothetical protein